MQGKRELLRQIRAKDETIAELTVQLREVRERLDVELQHRENLTEAENIDADEKAALKRGNDRLKEDNQRLIDELNDLRAVDADLHALYNARERQIVIKHGERVSEGVWEMPYEKATLDEYGDEMLATSVYMRDGVMMVEVREK